MYFNGKIYRIKPADEGTRQAYEALLQFQIVEFAIFEVEATVASIKWMLGRLCPDFPLESVTEENRRELLRLIRLAQTDPERAQMVETRDARKFMEGNP
jgi:hypothetical protein